jgi:methionyl-tRNA synthetase
MLYPFLPFSSQKVHEFLGFKGNIEEYARKYPLKPLPEPGQKLFEPKPLFTKLDEKLIEEETARLGQAPD